MTFLLKTESHGEIESGFYANFTKLARLGKYTFEVKDLCELAQCLAKNPKIRELHISGYYTDKFWEMQERYIESFKELVENTNKNIVSEVMDIFFKQNRGKISLEERADLVNERITIPIRINDDGSSLKIGEYEIEDIHFGRMVYYLANGGFIGWGDDKKPDFAEQALSAIRESKNSLYKEIQRE